MQLQLLKKSNLDSENFKKFRQVSINLLFISKAVWFQLVNYIKLITWVNPIIRLIRVFTARKQPYLEFMMIFCER